MGISLGDVTGAISDSLDDVADVYGADPQGDGKGGGIEKVIEALGNFFIRGSIFAMGAVMLTIGLIGLSKQE